MKSKQLQRFLRTHKYLFPIIVVFAVVGSLLLVLGNAQAPQLETDELLLATDTTAGYQKVDASVGSFEHTKSPTFRFDYDPTWALYEYVDPNNTDLGYALVRLTSPGTTITGKDHDGNEQVASGNVIEVSAAPNEQYASVEEFLAQLGGYVVHQRSTKLAGLPAVEYRLSSSLEYESSTKHITMLIHDGVQYSVSLNNIDKTTEASQNMTYQQILQSFSLDK
jgi:hypothetical protein